MNSFDMELTQKLAMRYRKASKVEKSCLLDEYCKLTRVKRNTAVHRFKLTIRNPYPRALPKKNITFGRNKKFVSTHKKIIQIIWDIYGKICAERLHPVIAEGVQQVAKSGKLKYFWKHDIRDVENISLGSLKRVIAEFPKVSSKKHKGRKDIYKQIPIHAHFGRNADKPGYIEVDYVEHNGGNSAGRFAITGTYVDVCTQWIARAAGSGKNLTSVRSIHTSVSGRIHHYIHEYHPDNCPTILKLLIERTLDPTNPKYRISRSRPYKKDDNAHVEQKNGDKVRKLVGYGRFDTPDQVMLLNRIYEIDDLISNFFIPSQKLIRYERNSQTHRILRRIHDTAKTPYQRLLEQKGVSNYVKMKLTKLYSSLSLIDSRAELNILLKRLNNI